MRPQVRKYWAWTRIINGQVQPTPESNGYVQSGYVQEGYVSTN